MKQSERIQHRAVKRSASLLLPNYEEMAEEMDGEVPWYEAEEILLGELEAQGHISYI